MLFLPLVAVVFLCSFQAEAQMGPSFSLDDQDGGQSSGWKCMLFTLQWPASFCQSIHEEMLCKIPLNVSDWTIHGLWPKAKNCCSCWPLFQSNIKDLEENLTQFWPSLLKSQTNFEFWQREWEKHGVCGATVETLNSPLQYFSSCLRLRDKFNLKRLFEDADIVPSCNKTYKVQQLVEIVTPVLGKHHEIQCLTNKQGQELWFQIKIALFSNETTGCSDHHWGPKPRFTHPCPPQVPLYYLPIDHMSPTRPCP